MIPLAIATCAALVLVQRFGRNRRFRAAFDALAAALVVAVVIVGMRL